MIWREGRDEIFHLQYEKLPFYCFGCGLLGHGELECKTPADRMPRVGSLLIEICGLQRRGEGGSNP
jgi:hypothetical protein